MIDFGAGLVCATTVTAMIIVQANVEMNANCPSRVNNIFIAANIAEGRISVKPNLAKAEFVAAPLDREAPSPVK